MYGNIHPTFHVNLLEPCHGRSRTPADPKSIVVDGEDEWEVEEILTRKDIIGSSTIIVAIIEGGSLRNLALRPEAGG